jgi:hypothetical protein
VRTELLHLLVIPPLVPHPIQNNRQAPRHRHLGDLPAPAHRQVEILAAPFRNASCRNLGSFHQQEAQHRAHLFGDVPQPSPVPTGIFPLLSAAVAGKQPNDHVLTREDGQPVRDFRGAWRQACKRAGVPELLVHDLRRTGVRNMRRAGNSGTICMKFSGHKTASMFRRYDITDDADMREAIVRLERKRNYQTAEYGQTSDRVAPNQGRRQIAQISTVSH